jgi:hypothetical protein
MRSDRVVIESTSVTITVQAASHFFIYMSMSFQRLELCPCIQLLLKLIFSDPRCGSVQRPVYSLVPNQSRQGPETLIPFCHGVSGPQPVIRSALPSTRDMFFSISIPTDIT